MWNQRGVHFGLNCWIFGKKEIRNEISISVQQTVPVTKHNKNLGNHLVKKVSDKYLFQHACNFCSFSKDANSADIVSVQN